MDVFSFVTELSPVLSQQITWLILHSLWQAALVAAAVFLINTLLWKNSARLRYTVAVSGLLLILCGVFLTWRIMEIEPTNVAVDAAPLPLATNTESIPAIFEPELPAVESESVVSLVSIVGLWAPYASSVYVIGVALMLLRLAISAIGVGRLRVASKLVNDQVAVQAEQLVQRIGIRVRPSLKTCERVLVPIVTGVIKPTILLPTFAISGMTQPELDAILLHELAHIRRGDLLVNLMQRIAESFLFFHPAIWYVSRVITNERENCCDDIVLGRYSQETYASALIRLAESCTDKDMAPIASLAATGASSSQLKRRVERILGIKRAPRVRPNLGVVLACLVAIAIGSVHLRAQTEDSKSTNADLSVRAPLVIRFDKTGKVSDFTIYNVDEDMPERAQRDRFHSILQELQSDESVLINLTRIRRRPNGKLSMTVEGNNLETEAIQAAIRHADLDDIAALKRNAKEKLDLAGSQAQQQRNNEQLRIESNGRSKVDDLRPHPARSIVQHSFDKLRANLDNASRRVKIEALVAQEQRNLDGPVRIEFVDDSDVFVVRGKKEDVDHIMKSIELSGINDAKTTENQNKKSSKSEHKLSAKFGSDGQRGYYVYDLKNVVAVQAAKELRTLLQRRDNDITVDTRTNGIVISDNVSRDELSVIRKTLEKMDRLAEGTTILRAYDALCEPTLKAMFEGVDQIRFRNDVRRQDIIMVDAPLSAHQQINAALEEMGKPVEFSPDLLGQMVKGKTLYKQHCVHCHGTNGNGDGPQAKFLNPAPRRFASLHYSKVRMGTADARQDLEALLRSGIKGTAMPSFKQLTQQERSSLAAYAEFLALRARYSKARRRRLKKERSSDVLETDVIKKNGPEGALRFPIDIERAMMGDAVGEIRTRSGWSPNPQEFEIDNNPKTVPEYIEKGMQIDALERDGRF